MSYLRSIAARLGPRADLVRVEPLVRPVDALARLPVVESASDEGVAGPTPRSGPRRDVDRHRGPSRSDDDQPTSTTPGVEQVRPRAPDPAPRPPASATTPTPPAVRREPAQPSEDVPERMVVHREEHHEHHHHHHRDHDQAEAAEAAVAEDRPTPRPADDRRAPAPTAEVPPVRPAVVVHAVPTAPAPAEPTPEPPDRPRVEVRIGRVVVTGPGPRTGPSPVPEPPDAPGDRSVRALADYLDRRADGRRR